MQLRPSPDRRATRFDWHTYRSELRITTDATRVYLSHPRESWSLSVDRVASDSQDRLALSLLYQQARGYFYQRGPVTVSVPINRKALLMKRVMLIVVLLAAFSHPLAAQSPTETLQAIAALQKKVDILSALVAARTGQPAPTMHAWIDSVQVNADAVYVVGWAFECTASRQQPVELAIDGVVVPNVNVLRTERGDVSTAAIGNGLCPMEKMPYYSGASGLVDLATYPAGPHTAEFRVRDAAGIVVKSNVKAFTIVR